MATLDEIEQAILHWKRKDAEATLQQIILDDPNVHMVIHGSGKESKLTSDQDIKCIAIVRKIHKSARAALQIEKKRLERGDW